MHAQTSHTRNATTRRCVLSSFANLEPKPAQLLAAAAAAAAAHATHLNARRCVLNFLMIAHTRLPTPYTAQHHHHHTQQHTPPT